MPVPDRELLADDLSVWLANSRGLMDSHTSNFIQASEWQELLGPGPIRVLPGIVERSLRVFAEAARIVRDLPGRHVDLFIELRWGRRPMRALPRTPRQLEKLLDVTPPSINVYDSGNGLGHRGRWPVSQRVELDGDRLFGGASSALDGIDCKTYFDEHIYDGKFPRYIVCTPERI